MRLDALSAHVARLASGLVSAPTRAALARVAMLRGLAAFEADAGIHPPYVHPVPEVMPAPRGSLPTPVTPPRKARPHLRPDDKRLVPIAPDALARIHALHAQGRNYPAIASALTEAGLPAPGGGAWDRKKVRRAMLANPPAP